MCMQEALLFTFAITAYRWGLIRIVICYRHVPWYLASLSALLRRGGSSMNKCLRRQKRFLQDFPDSIVDVTALHRALHDMSELGSIVQFGAEDERVDAVG